jgi:hypothetical protein
VLRAARILEVPDKDVHVIRHFFFRRKKTKNKTKQPEARFVFTTSRRDVATALGKGVPCSALLLVLQTVVQ